MNRVRLLRFTIVTVVFLAIFGATRIQNATAQNVQYVADSGFRPATNGFPFENYGNADVQQNLTANEMKRMFGDQVCGATGKKCVLTPPAQEWMDETNKAMDGGHCEGMAALSALFYKNAENVKDFGANSVNALSLSGNAKLQSEIAYFWATQATNPTADSTLADKTPADIVNMLIQEMKAADKSDDLYTVGIFKRDFKDGHAITPYAVMDKGNSIFWIMVYDNNFPKDERHIEVDTQKNTWSYSSATNPSEPESLYEGDAESKTLQLTPNKSRLDPQKCPFCSDNTSARAGILAQTVITYNQVWLVSSSTDNNASILIKDENGHRLGYDNGKLVNEIPNAQFTPLKSDNRWKASPSPIFYVPTGVAFTVTVDGDLLTTAEPVDLAVIGPSYDLAVEGIQLDPDQKDTIAFSADGKTLSYTTAGGETPTLDLGIQHQGADYDFQLEGATVEGGTITVALDYDKGQLSVKSNDAKKPVTYHLAFSRIDNDTEQNFSHDNLALDAGDTAYVDFGKWTGTDVNIETDKGSTGTVTSTASVSNEEK